MQACVVGEREAERHNREGGLTHLLKPKIMRNNSVEFTAIKT